MEKDSFQTSLWKVDENRDLFLNQSLKDSIDVVAVDHGIMYNKNVYQSLFFVR